MCNTQNSWKKNLSVFSELQGCGTHVFLISLPLLQKKKKKKSLETRHRQGNSSSRKNDSLKGLGTPFVPMYKESRADDSCSPTLKQKRSSFCA